MVRLLTKYQSVDKQLTLVSLFTCIESIRHDINIISSSTVMKGLLTSNGDVFIIFDGNYTTSAAIKCNWQSMFNSAFMLVCLCQSYEVMA